MVLQKWLEPRTQKINAKDYIIQNTKIVTSQLRNLEPNWTNLPDYVIENLTKQLPILDYVIQNLLQP